jgi:hypothetical protein
MLNVHCAAILVQRHYQAGKQTDLGDHLVLGHLSKELVIGSLVEQDQVVDLLLVLQIPSSSDKMQRKPKCTLQRFHLPATRPVPNPPCPWTCIVRRIDRAMQTQS